ncbi:MAG: NF038104 family lipoprotein [Gammaproteobacteria bacterium]|nr:NF038104 family lipoprotein [Gammaproteobacteria bacterium]
MRILSKLFRKFRSLVLIGLSLLLFSCVGAVVGAAVDTTIEVVKIPFKVVGAAVDLVVPDGDDE